MHYNKNIQFINKKLFLYSIQTTNVTEYNIARRDDEENIISRYVWQIANLNLKFIKFKR